MSERVNDLTSQLIEQRQLFEERKQSMSEDNDATLSENQRLRTELAALQENITAQQTKLQEYVEHIQRLQKEAEDRDQLLNDKHDSNLPTTATLDNLKHELEQAGHTDQELLQMREEMYYCSFST